MLGSLWHASAGPSTIRSWRPRLGFPSEVQPDDRRRRHARRGRDDDDERHHLRVQRAGRPPARAPRIRCPHGAVRHHPRRYGRPARTAGRHGAAALGVAWCSRRDHRHRGSGDGHRSCSSRAGRRRHHRRDDAGAQARQPLAGDPLRSDSGADDRDGRPGRYCAGHRQVGVAHRDLRREWVGRLVGGTIGLLVSPTPTAAMLGIAIGAWTPAIAGAPLLRGHLGPGLPVPIAGDAARGTALDPGVARLLRAQQPGRPRGPQPPRGAREWPVRLRPDPRQGGVLPAPVRQCRHVPRPRARHVPPRPVRARLARRPARSSRRRRHGDPALAGAGPRGRRRVRGRKGAAVAVRPGRVTAGRRVPAGLRCPRPARARHSADDLGRRGGGDRPRLLARRGHHGTRGDGRRGDRSARSRRGCRTTADPPGARRRTDRQ